MDWGAGAGRAHTVREPPPQFVALLQKTGTVRDAAKTLMAAEQTREEAGSLKPAFNAIPTFNTLKGADDNNIEEIANLVFCVTTVGEEIPSPCTIQFAAWVVQETSLWMVRQDLKPQRVVHIPMRGSDPDPPIALTQQVSTLLKGCGILSALGVPLLQSVVDIPTGCLVWASDLMTTLPIEDLLPTARADRRVGENPRRAPALHGDIPVDQQGDTPMADADTH